MVFYVLDLNKSVKTSTYFCKLNILQIYTFRFHTNMAKRTTTKENNNSIKSVNDNINVTGARVHNLKNIDVHIPRNQFVVITGISGSGKSSLAFDTIYAEGQRRYMETFSAYARQFIEI